MAAANTDKLKKYKSLFSTTLSTGIGTGTGDTITPATVTGLPTDTAITLTIDRVDSGGVATPSKMERIKGVIAGGNLTSYVRGVDGTTEQAHTAGAVVEMIWNADDWNNSVDWGLVEHKQDGTHGDVTADSLTLPAGATITEISTDGTLAGNSDDVVPTEKATKTYVDGRIAKPGSEAQGDVLYNNGSTWTRLGAGTDGQFLRTQGVGANPIWASAKITNMYTGSISTSYDAATGDVSYTGVGFQPNELFFYCSSSGGSGYGWTNSSTHIAIATGHNTSYFISDISTSRCVYLTNASGTNRQAAFVSMNADGFTLNWTKTSTPTGNIRIMYIAIKTS